MSWEQIRELHEAGYEIGSHTHRHRPLISLSDGEAAEELSRSREVLAQRLGTAPGFFAYPRSFFEERHKRLVREAGYAGACSVILKWKDLGRSEPFDLRRMPIKGTESMLRFHMRLRLAGMLRHDRAAG
jgi:peptidoglycan/xylan/chitin deacetylase (PgdA/CDA1 family)